MRHASLFSGIGGFDLAAQWMGWENVFQVEIDGFCQKVLEKNFPGVARYGDIKQFDGTKYRGAVDILTGGFPCQPYSTAGKRRGKEDARHLWPEMLRVIREIQPSHIVGENVSGLLNWNGGLVFDEVQAEMENEGYEVQSFILPACAVNAPHRRDRVWIIAHAGNVLQSGELVDGGNRNQKKGGERANERKGKASHGERIRIESIAGCQAALLTNSRGVILQRGVDQVEAEKTIRHPMWRHPFDNGAGFKNFPTQSPICRGNDGIPNRVDRIKSLGNAIVPQVAFEIFKAIESVNQERV